MTAKPNKPPVRFFKSDDSQFGLEIALGATYRRGADVGETLATAARIKDGDADAWLREWLATADRCRDAALDAARAGRRVSAVAALPPVRQRITRRRCIASRTRAIPRPGMSSRSGGASARAGSSWWICSRFPASASRSPTRTRRCLDSSFARPTRRPASNGRSWCSTTAATVSPRDVDRGRRRRRRARLPLDDLRRARPAGRAVRAGHPVPARLGGGADAGPRRDARAEGRRL